MDPDSFGHMQRVANILAMSPLFPEHLRKGSKESAIANGVLVMNMAMRLNEDPLTVAQNIYFVGGKPGWSASYMISKANQHGVFKNPIDWKVDGRGTENLSVTAVAELAATGKKVEVTCDMAMAKAEGWTKNAKYQSMPEQMLRYRSATFLIRLYCPEVMVGVPATIEIEANQMKDITPDEEAAIYAERAAEDDTTPEPEDAEEVQDKESSNPKTQAKPAEKPASREKVDYNPTDEAKEKSEDTAQEPEKSVPSDGADTKHVKIKEQIEGDLTDGAPVDELRRFYEADLDTMQAEAPDLRSEVEKMLNEAAE
ncbi:hypothetical protein [Pseudooceanicola atlanticus]|uniref:hypothetical protein n=1 Tax=Pseudooceanicola atlanticus TaxID=1461694 RepID=UPI002353EC95|nr:hypothetical protein [Pseudooceanicola atlanticus]